MAHLKKFSFTIGTEYAADGCGIYWSNDAERTNLIAHTLKHHNASGWTILHTTGGWCENCGCSLVEEQGLRVEVVGLYSDEWAEAVAADLAEAFQQSCVMLDIVEVRCAFVSASRTE